MQRKLDYKWVVLLLVSIAYFLAQGTRLIYSAVLPQIKADFAASGVTDAQLQLDYSDVVAVLSEHLVRLSWDSSMMPLLREFQWLLWL